MTGTASARTGKRRTTVLCCAILLAVAGCSGDQSVDDLPDPATLSAEPTAEPTADPTADDAEGNDSDGNESDSDDPADAISEGDYTPDELEAVLVAVNEEESLAGVILTDAEIRELVPESGEETSSDLTVTPEECDVFADTDVVDQALNSTLAVMTFAGASSLQPDSLGLTSQSSDAAIQGQLQANRAQLEACAEFQLEIAGETVDVAVTELAATTTADETFAVGTVVEIPGTIQETVSLTALQGTTTINVTVGSSGDREEDLARGESLVDAAVDALQDP